MKDMMNSKTRPSKFNDFGNINEILDKICDTVEHDAQRISSDHIFLREQLCEFTKILGANHPKTLLLLGAVQGIQRLAIALNIDITPYQEEIDKNTLKEWENLFHTDVMNLRLD